MSPPSASPPPTRPPPARPPGARPGASRIARLGLALAATLVSLGLAEGIFRLAGVTPPRLHPRKVFLIEPERLAVDEWGIDRLRVPSADRRLGALRGEYIPGIRFEFCYDVSRGDRRPYFDERGCVVMEVNSDNLRGPDRTIRKPPGTWRVAAVGDSFTFGEGVPWRHIWPTRLAENLSSRPDRPPFGDGVERIEVVNLGVSGFNAKEVLVYLRHKALRYDPDVVVYGFFLNDVFEGGQMDADTLAAYRTVYSPPTGLAAASRLVDWVTFARARRRMDRLTEEMYLDSFAGGARSQEWLDTQDNLTAMRDVCAERGLPFVVLIFPVLSSLDDGYPFGDVHAELHAFLDGAGIAWVDMLEPFRERGAEALRVHATDLHPNEIAHDLAASAVERHLRTLLEATPR